MSSKRELEAAEEKPAKRPRLTAGALKQDSDAVAVPFDSLNNDCLVHIMSFLEIDEMNDVTLINSALRAARNADSLDQTRTATIVIKNEGTLISKAPNMLAAIQRMMMLIMMMLCQRRRHRHRRVRVVSPP